MRNTRCYRVGHVEWNLMGCLWHVRMFDCACGSKLMRSCTYSQVSRVRFSCGSPQALPGVPKLREGVNPATWMLEISTPAAEQRLNLDFAEAYRNSKLYRCVVHCVVPVQPFCFQNIETPA